jgi:serine protease AprX
MSKIDILLEIEDRQASGFEFFNMVSASALEGLRTGESLVEDLAGFGLELTGECPPVPMFSVGNGPTPETLSTLMAFSSPDENPDMKSTSTILTAQVPINKLESLRARAGVKIWPNSKLTYLGDCNCHGVTGLGLTVFDLATSSGGIDCRPFRPAASVSELRQLLGVESIWNSGFRGQNVVVAIIDEGVNGEQYPVIGGLELNGERMWGRASVQSHGSMCAADILVAAPQAKLMDFPFLANPSSGGAINMFHQVLEQRRRNGTPHLTNNSYGFVGVPPIAQFPHHEIHDSQHPAHRKVREVIASGAPAFFAAGNCGQNCPSGNCQTSGVGPGRSIHASNSLEEVITVAAVNSRHERIGYSSQGPGMFAPQKPDIAAYSHFFGNFGPGRPAGGTNFDNGTSAATPVAAGVAALLLSSGKNISPARLKEILIKSAVNVGPIGWDTETGWGVINAAAAFALVTQEG